MVYLVEGASLVALHSFSSFASNSLPTRRDLSMCVRVSIMDCGLGRGTLSFLHQSTGFASKKLGGDDDYTIKKNGDYDAKLTL